MMRRALLVGILGALAVLVGVTSARAADTFYFVTGVGDVGGSCSPYPNVPGAFQCTTLRAAVDAANADAAEDDIYLQDGQTYSVNQAIPLTTDVAIFSGNARTTTLQSGAVDRLFTIAPGVHVTLYGLTLKGGNAPNAGDGGAIDNAGSLELIETRVTGNRATNGGGIANEPTGTLSVQFSLIDNNEASIDGGVGGGIVNHGSLDEVVDSTIALNSAGEVGGISSDGDSFTSMQHATVAGNQSSAGTAGVSFLTGDWSSTGSMFTANLGDSAHANCNTPQSSGSANLADDGSCGFGTAGDSHLGLPTTIQLISDGGMTDVVDVTGTPAKGFEASCSTPYDQRLGQRQLQAPCDAGAYEQGVPAGAVSPLFPFPTPVPTATPPPTPTPTPSATPMPTPTPVAGKTVVAKPVKGTIKIKLPGTNRFIELDTTTGIPVGATVDARHGTVQLTALQTPGGKTETASFFDGLFKLTQTKSTTDLTLNEPLAPCGRRARASAAASKKKPKTRQLWGSGHGSFRTKGQYSAATVRGTKWLVQDSCAGTLTRVAQGVVSVRDNVRRKTIILRAGKKYLARPRRG